MKYPDTNYQHAAPTAVPQAGWTPTPNAGPDSQAENVKRIEKSLEIAKQAEQAAIVRAELATRINTERSLAAATTLLLGGIEGVLLSGYGASNQAEWATFRKELQPLAESYGVRIVLVGDKTRATLVRI